jgi:hypothetical protein
MSDSNERASPIECSVQVFLLTTDLPINLVRFHRSRIEEDFLAMRYAAC